MKNLTEPLGTLSLYITSGKLADFIVSVEEAEAEGEGEMRKRLQDQFVAAVAQLLAQNRVTETLAELCAEHSPRLGWRSQYRRIDLALLDMKYLDAAHFHLFGSRMDVIKDLIDDTALTLGRPSILTYEELVMINPLDDLRLFSKGVRAKAERTFYTIHYDIEDILRAVITDLVMIRDNLVATGKMGAEDPALVKYNIEHFNHVFQNIGMMMRDLSRDEFLKFRTYISAYGKMGEPDYLPGPSGAFTASIPIVEFLLAGDQSEKDYLIFVSKNFLHYPVVQRNLMKQLAEGYLAGEAKSLLTLADEQDDEQELRSALRGLADKLKTFRQKHMGMVRSKLPESFKGSMGAGNTRDFLENRINQTPTGD